MGSNAEISESMGCGEGWVRSGCWEVCDGAAGKMDTGASHIAYIRKFLMRSLTVGIVT